MSLQGAIQSVMRTRQLPVSDLLARMPARHRSTVYRLLKGDILDTKVSTLLAVCQALSITPNELLVSAGLWDGVCMGANPLDTRLDRTVGVVRDLAVPYKLVAVTQIERLVETWQEVAGGSIGREPDAAGDV
jgi:DNA-binding Xre family transcriptional regulator